MATEQPEATDSTGSPPPEPEATWPMGPGEVARHIRELDWSATPLGPPPGWPLRLRILVDLLLASPEPAYIAWGPELIAIYNDAYIEILGDKHPPALGQPFEKVFAEIRDEFLPLVQATLAGQAQHFVDRLVTPPAHENAPRRWFTFSWTPIREDDGSVAGFYGTATETTHKLLAQQALREAQQQALQASERRYQTLFESIDEGFCVLQMIFDQDGRPMDYRFLEVNPAFERQTGMVDARGRTMLEMVPGIERKWIETYGRVALTGEPIRFVDHSPTMRRWFDVYAFRVGTPEEKLVALLFNDITRRHEAEERQKAIFEIQTVGMMVWGPDFGLTDMNDAFLRMTGFTREEALGKTWQDLTPPEFHLQSWNAVREVSTRGETTPYEKQYYRKDGSRWWGLFAARRIGDEVVELVLDVTQRRQVEAALRAADERKDVFLATLAHELRNPLAPLRNGLQIARLTQCNDDSTLRRTVDMMDRQLSHLVRLVDDLLDVGRISSGKLLIKREPVLLSQVLANSIEATRGLIEQQRHQLEVHAPDHPLQVLGDFDRLSQVFINLVTNAAKYSEPGGLIRLTLGREGRDAVIQVADTGIGIPPGETERVFDLFSQVREHQHHSLGGLGIGLSLVRSLVASHGGEVHAFSEGEGRGSCFTVRLPSIPPAADAHPPVEQRARDDGRPLPSVLVVDDSHDAAASLAELLRLEGYEARAVNDGAQAVQAVEDHAPDVVILDLGMPRLDGFEAAVRIRALEQGKKLRLIALSGWGQDADRARTAAAGFDAHLIKPVDLQTLKDSLDGSS